VFKPIGAAGLYMPAKLFGTAGIVLGGLDRAGK